MKILFPISLLLISGILFFLIVDPLFVSVKQLKNDVSTYNLALNNSTELQKVRDSLLEKYRNISNEDKEKLNNFLPNTVNNIKFILEIEQIANLHSMPLKNIKFEDKQQQSDIENKIVSGSNMIVSNNEEDSLPYGTFPIEFITEGRYDAFTLFLKDLERNLRVMDIQSISFVVPQPVAKPDVGYDPNVYSYTLKVETYWLK
jgi:hypothetical protein